MEICIRRGEWTDYPAVERLMKQVQQMHIDLRPDIYQYSETVLPVEAYEQALGDETFFIAEYEGKLAGILLFAYRHIEGPKKVTRDIISVDYIAVEEKYRGRGIGHAFFDFLQALKAQKGYDAIELQVCAKNEAAYRMYQRYGFTEKAITMELL